MSGHSQVADPTDVERVILAVIARASLAGTRTGLRCHTCGRATYQIEIGAACIEGHVAKPIDPKHQRGETWSFLVDRNQVTETVLRMDAGRLHFERDLAVSR